jgi:Calcineurin-like phosphoesterase
VLIRPLFEGPLDIVGDIHGEVDALRALLARLGYVEGKHPQSRRLVFVGDLSDRGPDSPAVIRIVRGFSERGLAQCVLGNHELNLLRAEHKHGNHWFYGDTNPEHEREFGPTTYCGPAERESILHFIAALPVALERSDLRVVHAAWHRDAIDACRAFDGAVAAFEHFDAAAAASHRGRTVRAEYEEDLRRYGDHLLKDPDERPPVLRGIGAYDEHCQMSNPLRVATSGVERITERPFFASGKWRFVERVAWWRTYTDSVPVVFGHYWRWWNAADGAALSKGEPNLFADDAPDAWQRNEAGRDVAICIDYSVGARFKERLRGSRSGFAGRLAALRWPERELVFDSEA